MRIFIATVAFLITLSVLSCGENPAPKISGSNSKRPAFKPAVSCATSHASEIGVSIMNKGGNAVDAAVAVQFALAVTFPEAGNIGGGGFMVIRLNDGSAHTLDFRETAPAAATRDMYLDAQKNPVKDLSLYGRLACGVPGSVAGMEEAHKKFGKLPWSEVIQPAIDLAEKGFALAGRDAESFNELHSKFIQYNPGYNYLVKEGAWKEGDILIQKDLAETLKRIRDNGAAGFYQGETARLFVDEMNRGKGIITAEDLKNYKALWRNPLQGFYNGYKVLTMAPPSSGGIALMQLLQMSEILPDKYKTEKNIDATAFYAECMKRAFADRAEYLGDPDFFKVPVEALLDSGYIFRRADDIIAGGNAVPSTQISAGVVPLADESEETTHFSVLDAEGNAVSVTTTINSSYGALAFVKGCGFLLNNEMDDFSVKPGVPNQFGLLGNKANEIEPGKRMLSSMTPVILEKNGKLFLITGSPGGSTIITTVFQVIRNVCEQKMSLQAAVDAPRFHHQWKPDILYVEYNFPGISELKRKGYTVQVRDAIGSAESIMVTPEGNVVAVGDKRRSSTSRIGN